MGPRLGVARLTQCGTEGRLVPRRIAYTYDARTARYRERTSGKFVTPQKVRGATNEIIKASRDRITAYTEAFRSRELTLGEWETRMRAEIRAVHSAAAIAAKGGREHMANADWGALGAKVKAQYQFLTKRADAIVSGRQAIDGSLTNRARMYASAALPTYLDTRGSELATRGFTEVRSIVHARESCAECLAQQARGFVNESDYTPIGQRTCLTSCACTEQRRNPLTGEIAA